MRIPMHRVLDELVFEKVRLGAQLANLLVFERDLDRSIQRALARCEDSADAQQQLLGKSFERACTKLEPPHPSSSS